MASRPNGIPTAANFGWREYFVASSKELHPVSREIQPLSVCLGALGTTGKPNVYFDNVGGEALEAALSALRVHGRIIACGGISGYNEEKPRPGPSNLFYFITKRLTMKGLLVRDWLDPIARDAVWKHLVDLRANYGTTLFFTTHYLEEAESHLHSRSPIQFRGRMVPDRPRQGEV